MLGISGKAVSKWERGLSKPCDEHLEHLINLLGLPVESTITAEGKENTQRTTFLSTIRKEFTRILATGAMIGVSPQAVYKREQNTCYPDIIFLPHLARILKCRVDDFFDNTSSAFK